MRIQDDLISFELAKELRDNGISGLDTEMYYTDDGEVHSLGVFEDFPDVSRKVDVFYPAPTASLLQKYFRNLDIFVNVSNCLEWYVEIQDYRNGIKGSRIFGGRFNPGGKPQVDRENGIIYDFQSYEEALDIGLQEALNYYINGTIKK